MAQELRHLISDAPRVMVVDGSKLVRKLIADVLQRELPGVEVIGCASIAEARAQLQSLRGRVHELHASVAMAVDGTVVWRSSDVARLRMRPFSDVFLERYLSAVGGDVCSTVGAYKLEGLGVQLFDRIEGDYFTVLGMPLMPLLAALRDRGVLEN